MTSSSPDYRAGSAGWLGCDGRKMVRLALLPLSRDIVSLGSVASDPYRVPVA